jgi:hypothetical protein
MAARRVHGFVLGEREVVLLLQKMQSQPRVEPIQTCEQVVPDLIDIRGTPTNGPIGGDFGP